MWQLVSVGSGLIGGLAVLFLGFIIQTNIWPVPDVFNQENGFSMTTFLNDLPLSAYVTKVITHALMCFATGLIAALIGNHGKAQTGIIALLLMFTLVLYRDFRFVYPTAYVMTSLFASGILGFFGVLIGSRK
jgi:hypothetical protein